MSKKYTSARRDLDKKMQFELAWYDDKGEEQIGTFFCYPGRLPGGILFDVLKINDGSAPFWEFWEKVMDPGAFLDFRDYVRKNPIDARILRDVMDDVIEFDTGRPTQQPTT